jgi:signal transduction histidine kinase
MQSTEPHNIGHFSGWHRFTNSSVARLIRRTWRWLTLVHTSDPLQQILNSAFAGVVVTLFLFSFILIPLTLIFNEPLVTLVSFVTLPFYILLWWLNRQGTVLGAVLMVGWMILTLIVGMTPSSYTAIDSPIPLVLIFPVLIAALFVRPQAAFWTVFALMAALAVRMSLADVPQLNQTRFLAIGTSNLLAFALILWVGTRIFVQALRRTIAMNATLSDLNLRLQQENTQRIEAENQLLEAQLNQLELESQKALIDYKQKFIASVSHDFRTPLAVIKTSTDLLDHYFDQLTLEQRTRNIKTVQLQVQRMVELLDEILVVHEAQSGQMAFDPVPTDIEALCDDLFSAFKMMGREHHQFSYVAEISEATVCADQKLLRHILTNLLSNAIKYSPQGGKIQLIVAVQNDEMTFAVTDEGLGIDAEDIERLFEPFYRAKNTRKIPGTGLGLSIVKSAVERHGGTITCTSALNKGTTFEVTIPVPCP